MRNAASGVTLVSVAYSLVAMTAPAVGAQRSAFPACPAYVQHSELAGPSLAACSKFIAGLPAGSEILVDALAAQARLQINTLDNEAALNTLDKALAIDPSHLDAGVLKVEALFRLGGWHESRADIERLLALYPNDPEVLRHHAQFVSIVGMPRDALRALDRAIAAAPETPHLRLQRAKVLVQLSRPDEARLELDAIIASMPHDALALEERARLFLVDGNPQEALADLGKAQELGYVTSQTNFLAARAHLMLGHHEKALAALEDASEFNNDSMLLLYRSAILERLDRDDEATLVMDTMLAEPDPQFILRIQVLLKNMGFAEVQINGEADTSMKRALLSCLASPTCGGKMSRAI